MDLPRNSTILLKNVTVLESKDVQVQNGAVLTPNNMKMAQIKKNEGHYKAKVVFQKSMNEESVRRKLEETFDILKGKRFWCAARKTQNEAELDFNGDRGIWNGKTINSRLRGGSALIIVIVEDELLQRLSRDTSNNTEADKVAVNQLNFELPLPYQLALAQYGVPKVMTVATPFDSGKTRSDSADFSPLDFNDLSNLNPTDPLGFKSDLGFENGGMNTHNSQGFDLEEFLPDMSPGPFIGYAETVSRDFPSTEDDNEESELSVAQYCVPQVTTMANSFDSGNTGMGDSADFSSLDRKDYSSLPRELPSPSTKENNEESEQQHKVLITSADASQSSDSALGSSEVERMSQDLPVVRHFQRQGAYAPEIEPKQGPLQGGEPFYLELERDLPPSVKFVWVTFGSKEVKAWKTYEEGLGSVTMHGKKIPPGYKPGPVTVTIVTPDGYSLGETIFTYTDQHKEAMKEIVSSKRKLAEFFQEASKHFKSDVSEENVPQQQSGNSNEDASLEPVDVLRPLVYTAAQIGKEELLRSIFTSSAGRVIFESYRKESVLPEDVAEAHDHKEVANYLREITKRFSENDEPTSLGLIDTDWNELVRAVEEGTTCSENSDVIRLKKVPKDYHISEEEYFGDAEKSGDSEEESADRVPLGPDTVEGLLSSRKEKSEVSDSDQARIQKLEKEKQTLKQKVQQTLKESQILRTIILELEKELFTIKQRLHDSSEKDLENFDISCGEDDSEDARNYLEPERANTESEICKTLQDLNKDLYRNVTSLLEVPEVKEDKLKVPVTIDLLRRVSIALQKLYNSVLSCVAETCKCIEEVRRKFYDLVYHGLRAEHVYLVHRVEDLAKAEERMTEEEEKDFVELQQFQTNRQRQVDRLENLCRNLFSTNPEGAPRYTHSDPIVATGKTCHCEKDLRLALTVPDHANSKQVLPRMKNTSSVTETTSKVRFTKFKKTTMNRIFRKRERKENSCCLVSYSSKNHRDS
ncbi:uncharacterized protein LOC111331832 isoform X2 [Stylophora pistillata]|uniref:uncharacterized protein LOC111331832 isoform X2 n=1 Tax=Stylophora pistillata TaxID=50429 RepID=UPI000C04506E|nr:uncharacterized protein LOC111331832 isoform X2 [Stylophora pistillata]